MKALVNSNPDLKEICTDTWEGGVKVSKKDKSILKKKGIEHHEENTIPDSDDEPEESEVKDEDGDSSEDRSEDSDGPEEMENSESSGESSEDRSEDSDGPEEMENSESSGEESSEDEIGGEIEHDEGSVTGDNVNGKEKRSSVWRRIVSFSLVSLILAAHLRLFGNYFFGNLS